VNRSSRNRSRIQHIHLALVNSLGTAGVCLAVTGCSSGPSRVDAPDYDPAGSAAKAMHIYDKDEDGFIAGEELNAAASLKASMATLDLDKDEKVSEDEISTRIAAWRDTGTGLTSVRCQVTLDARPLVGVTVTLEPEDFLVDTIQPAIGTTNRDGIASPKIPKEKRPTADTPPGIQLGFYKILVSKNEGGSEQIPAKYNTETVLGQQIAPDDPQVKGQMIMLNLTSKS
jgi:hypothetical protein